MSKDKVKKFGDLAYEYIRKKLIKPGKGGITSLPTDKEITNEMLVMFENLREAGYNVTNIGKEVKNADDLGFLINRIEQAKINQAKEFSDAAEALETIQFKLNNNIPLNPDDQKKLLGKGFKTSSDAFKGFEPKIIQGGKREVIQPKNAKQDVIAANENLAGGANYAKGDTKYNADILAEEIAKSRGIDVDNIPVKDKIKLYGEAYDYLTEFNRLNKSPKKESMVKNVAEAMFGPIGKKEGKEGIEQLLEEGKITKGTAPKTKKTKPAVDPELQKSEDLKKEFKDFEDRTEIKDLDDEPDGLAMGGIAKTRIGMNVGGRLLKFLSENSPFQAYRKYLKSVKERAQKDPGKLFPELAAVTSGGILVNRKAQRILEGMKEQDNERFLKEFKEDIEKDPFYKDRPELKDKVIADYTESLFGEKKAMGGRIGFKEGGGMTRRTFLKLLGGLASIPLVGKFLKPAAKVAKTAEIAKQGGVPAYFPKLVEKIKLLGDDVTDTAATLERQRVIDYKDYTLTEDISTGAITIDKRTEGGGMFRVGDEMEYESGIIREERMEYTPPETIIGKDNKPVKVPAQYEEITVKPDFEGKMKDVDFGLDSYDEILKEVGESKIKKSGGGLAYMMGE